MFWILFMVANLQTVLGETFVVDASVAPALEPVAWSDLRSRHSDDNTPPTKKEQKNYAQNGDSTGGNLHANARHNAVDLLQDFVEKKSQIAYCNLIRSLMSSVGAPTAVRCNWKAHNLTDRDVTQEPHEPFSEHQPNIISTRLDSLPMPNWVQRNSAVPQEFFIPELRSRKSDQATADRVRTAVSTYYDTIQGVAAKKAHVEDMFKVSGEQFYSNRGKKDAVEQFLDLTASDMFMPNRGKKNDKQQLVTQQEQQDNRHHQSQAAFIDDILAKDLFFPNRGRKRQVAWPHQNAQTDFSTDGLTNFPEIVEIDTKQKLKEKHLAQDNSNAIIGVPDNVIYHLMNSQM